MKLLAYIVAVILATALLLGGGLLVGLAEGEELSSFFGLAFASLTVFVYGPLLLGSLSAYWNVKVSGESRKTFRLWLAVIVGLEVLAGVAIVTYAVLLPAPVWLPALFIGGGILLTAVGLVVGPALFRHDERRGGSAEPWSPVSRDEVRRKIAVVAITFGAGLVIALVGLALLFFSLDDADSSDIGAVFVMALNFAFLAAAIATLVVSLAWNRRLKHVLGGDLGVGRRMAKVVLRGKDDLLGEGEAPMAARYAATISTILTSQLCFVVLLYLSLALQQVQLLLSDPSNVLSLVLLVALPVVLLVLIPWTVLRIKRARRYARDHANLLRQDPAGGGDHREEVGVDPR
ncbi:hypothetical protein OH146_02840 [Salinibacterium sp. SYSU T00001]|uniref:hypothetical protein n=1 Tax=Homoserinimonas sedimenticola TaxID=2986805 RepID=UPI002236087B|nr:hypothetical protein [Salinibacterium sedimenticola]MCW4384705.1 hypothetical protein [Salinibacterium sedimenticola]